MTSAPLYLGADDLHYDQLPSGSNSKSSYAAYVSYKKTRAPMLYVGATTACCMPSGPAMESSSLP